MKPLIALNLLFVSWFACAENLLTPPPEHDNNGVKNIIMIVADGMGPAYTSAFRYFNDDPKTAAIENSVFDRHLVGLVSTYPAPQSGYITDSAAAATALATGIKTYNGAISVDIDKKPLLTVLEKAKQLGKKTGVVVTSQVNHATPASYLSHNESRRNYNELADSYIDNGIKADVILGGGWQYFIREDRNLVKEFQQAGFHYVDTYQQLTKLAKQPAVLGLFADKGLPWALDDSNKHRLALMTKAAIKQLENPQGYFLLIEASQVDWAGHSNDIAAAMAEMADLAKTLEYLEGYVENNPNTIVVLTADHSTGGFTIAANGLYQWHPNVLRQMTQSTEAIAKQLVKSKVNEINQRALLPFELSATEINQMQTAKQQVQKKLSLYSALSSAQKQGQTKPDIKKALYKQLNKIVDQRTVTGWTSTGHTGIDVPIFSFGAQSQLFNGYQDNTQIAEKIFTLLNSSASKL